MTFFFNIVVEKRVSKLGYCKIKIVLCLEFESNIVNEQNVSNTTFSKPARTRIVISFFRDHNGPLYATRVALR